MSFWAQLEQSEAWWLFTDSVDPNPYGGIFKHTAQIETLFKVEIAAWSSLEGQIHLKKKL